MTKPRSDLDLNAQIEIPGFKGSVKEFIGGIRTHKFNLQMKSVGCTLPLALYEKLQDYAIKNNIPMQTTMSKALERVISEFFDKDANQDTVSSTT